MIKYVVRHSEFEFSSTMVPFALDNNYIAEIELSTFIILNLKQSLMIK